MSEPETPAKRPPRCPICGKPRDLAFRPFCSRRCRNIDLHRWFGEAYAVPAVDLGEEHDDGPGPPARPGGE